MMRRLLSTLALCCLIVPAAVLAQDTPEPEPELKHIVVEDFESGIGDWFTNDDEAAGEEPSKKCAIYAVSGAAPDSGEQCGRIEFHRARSGWASVSLPVEGRTWAEEGCSTLSFWIRGDGSGEPLRIVLRLQTTKPKRDIAYSQVIRVEGTDWERYSFRSFGFSDTEGNILAPEDIQHIKILQFAKNGGLGDFRFRLDHIVVEAEPDALPIPKPVAETPRKTITLEPDFAKAGPYALAQIGTNLGTPPTIADNEDDGAISWAYALLSDLAPCVVRVELDGYLDREAGTYDLDLLDQHLEWIARCGAKSLICLNVPSSPEDTPETKQQRFAAFVQAVTTVVEKGAEAGASRYYEVFDEPLLSDTFADVDHVVRAYNSLTKLIRGKDPKAQVGGPGFSSAWSERIEGFLKGADHLDFLSLHFYGTHSAITDSQALFEAAYKTRAGDLPQQLSFHSVCRLVKKLRDAPVPVFITEFAMNSAQDETGDSRDERTSTAFGAAWLATAVASGTPFVDKMLHYQLKPGGWGIMSQSGSPEVSYWAAWLLKTYAPRGSVRQGVELCDDLAVAATIKTRSAHNVIVTYAGIDPIEIQVKPKNVPPLKQVRDRRISDGDAQWKGSVLVKEGDQTILMEGPGVVVLQYIVAPKTTE